MKRRYLLGTVAAIFLVAGFLWITWPPPQDRKCATFAGRLDIQHIHQENSSWCWVATVSEVLGWHRLLNSQPCHLYDLWHGTTACQDQATDPSWRAKPQNNYYGAPEDAATKYKDVYGAAITVTTRQSSSYGGGTAAPLSFEEIRDMICPGNNSLGKPFIWAYVEDVEDGTEILHDKVVFGYAFIPQETPRLLFAYDPQKPPDLPSLEPYTYEYDDHYGDAAIWREDVIISQYPSILSQAYWWVRRWLGV